MVYRPSVTASKPSRDPGSSRRRLVGGQRANACCIALNAPATPCRECGLAAGDQKAVHQADTPGGDGARMGRRVGDLSLTHPIGTSAMKMGYTASRWHMTSATFSLKP
jgi:hypothetical protein